MTNFDNIKPIWDRLLIKPEPIEEKTAGGLFIPDQAKSKPQLARIIAAGSGRTNPDTGLKLPMSCKVGDLVLFDPENGYPLTINSESVLMINDIEILAVMNE